ncbi:MAG: symporter small accessory protein [Bacillota bacterium]
MLGMADGWTSLVWLLNIASMLFCVGYGIANWNKGGEDW